MKWLIILLTPLLAFSSPNEELRQIFHLSERNFHKEAQALWLQTGKERWQYESRFEQLRPQLWPIFTEMGMVEEIKPAQNHYETVLILGALLKRVAQRVDYLVQTGITFDQIVFLSGERPLQPEERDKTGLQTESEMVKWVYENSTLPKNIPVVWIEVPMKGTQRPNTSDTVLAWLKTNPNPRLCLAISNQPYIHYQEAVLKQLVPFPLEVAGPRILDQPSVDLMLDTIAREWSYKYGELQ